MLKKVSLGTFFFIVLSVVAFLAFTWFSYRRTNYDSNQFDDEGVDVTSPFYATPKGEAHEVEHGGNHEATEGHHEETPAHESEKAESEEVKAAEGSEATESEVKSEKATETEDKNSAAKEEEKVEATKEKK